MLRNQRETTGFLMALLAAMLVGCGSVTGPSASGGGFGSRQPAHQALPITLLSPDEPVGFATALKTGASAAAQSLRQNNGPQIELTSVVYRNHAELQRDLQVAARAASAVLLVPDSQGMETSCLQPVLVRHVPILALGQDINPRLRRIYVGARERDLGRRLAFEITTTGLKTPVGMLASPDDPIRAGADEVFASHPGIHVQEFNPTTLPGVDLAKLIACHPLIHTWVVLPAQLIAHPEIFLAHPTTSPKVYTVGCTTALVPLLRAGLLRVVCQPGFDLGYLGVYRAADITFYGRTPGGDQRVDTPLLQATDSRQPDFQIKRWGFFGSTFKHHQACIEVHDTAR